jgi:hypothetical protein
MEYAELTGVGVAEYCAKKAWTRFQADPKQWQQTIMDLDGDYHYCLIMAYNKTVKVHGIFDHLNGNYREIRIKMD